MKSLLHSLAVTMLMMLVLSCSHKKDEEKVKSSPPIESQRNYIQGDDNVSTDSNEDDDNDEEDDENDDSDGKIKDDTYTASVDYYNPITGYSATYTLEVEVSDGQVIRINFPNDGYLDSDHITPADIDENGDAHVEGEEGKTYDVHINI